MLSPADPPSLPTVLVVNAVSACTALATSWVESAFLLRRGSSAVRESALVTPDEQPLAACAQPLLEPLLVGPARLFALTELAVADLPVELRGQLENLRLKVYPLLDQDHAGQLPNGQRRADVVGFELKARVESALRPGLPSDTTARDVTAFAELLPRISEDLASGAADVAVVIAAHSDLSPERVSTLFAQDRLFTEDNDDGLLLGEGAVLLVLSTPDTTRHRRLPQLARILAVHRAFDRARPDNDESAFEAIGLTFAFRGAVAAAPAGKVGWVYSDLNFERYRVNEYQSVLARCQELMGPPQLHEFPSQRLGNLGAATGPLHVALAAAAWKYGFGASSHCLSLAGHEDGTRCGVLLAT